MNVLLVSDWFPPAWSAGGAAVSTWNLALALARAGVAVTVVTTDAYTGPPGTVPRVRDDSGMRIVTARVARSAGRYADRYGLAPAMAGDLWRAAGWADVCVMQGLWTWPVAAGSRVCALRGVPYVLSAKGTLVTEALRERSGRKRVYRRLIAGAAIRRAAAVHYASELEKERSAPGAGRARGVVIPNACEARPLAPLQGAELRTRLGLPGESLLVGIAGRVHPQKGFDTLLPALAGVDRRVHLVIFGSDHEGHLSEVRALAAACRVPDRIHALGELDPDGRDRAYASVDLLAMPSHFETFGNVVVEALRQGTPVMISDQVPLSPYVTEHGLGTVVPARDKDAWTAALARWAAAPPRLDREVTAGRIARDFSLETMADRWMDLLKPLVRGVRV